MAQRSHVPKFGNWDGDNVPYTAYFEIAHKEKTGGGTRINPNDPEQNPEAFNIRGPRGGSSNVSHVVEDSVSISPDNKLAPQKFVRERNFYDQQKNASHKTMASESSSDKNASYNSVTSVPKPRHQRKKSDRNKYASDSHNHGDDLSFRSVSVPKFGQWDENDPRSAAGFTVIFNKVKEEKHIAASKFPPVPVQTINDDYQTSQKKETRKKCCCLF